VLRGALWETLSTRAAQQIAYEYWDFQLAKAGALEHTNRSAPEMPLNQMKLWPPVVNATTLHLRDTMARFELQKALH